MKKMFNLVVGGLVLVSLFLPGNIFAQSGCTYTIKSMEAQPANVTADSIITFHAIVEQGGSGPACQNYSQPNFVFYAKVPCQRYSPDGNFCMQPNIELMRKTVDFRSTTSKTVSFQYDLRNFDMKVLEKPNTFPYFMTVEGGGYEFATTKNWGKTLFVSGSTAGSGTSNLYNVTVSFDKSEVSPLGGDLVVYINMNGTDLDKLPSSVRVLTYVNNTQVGNNTGVYKNYLTNNKTYQMVPVKTTTGFKDGQNTVKVDIQDDVSPYRLYARGTGTIIGKDLGAGTPSTPSTPANPGDQPQTQNPGDQPGGEPDPTLNETLYNPLPTDSLTGTILTIAKGFLAIVALWAVVFIIIGGFRMVLSQGNEEAYLAAKKTIIWAVLGVVVAMLSFSIIAIVQSLLGVSVPDFPGSQTPVVENKETNN